MTHRTAPVVRSLLSPASLVFALAIAVGAQACSCAVGRPDGAGDAATDVPVVPVDGGYDAGDSGPPPEPCGDGVIDSEAGEVCDPNAPSSSLDVLRCICTDDDPCTDDEWVPANGSVCFGSCTHTDRSGFGIDTCDDGDSCTVDTTTSGTPAECNVTCTNLPPGYTTLPPHACGTGPCASTGDYTCENGLQIDNCTPGTPGGADNDCDGADDNCNGSADEGFVQSSDACGTGACASTGVLTCVNGVQGTTCVAGTAGPTDNTCNNIDENCNGFTDEGYLPVPTNCGVGSCASTGYAMCYPGGFIQSTCVAGTPVAEECDLFDNDCDGVLNDGNPGGGIGCTTANLGRCAAGTTSCVSGGIACIQTNTPISETCNGLDDNCNGMADDGTSGGACPTMVPGACATGVVVCNGAAGTTCMQTVMPTTEVCDAVDNDCDGSNNESLASVACTSANPGICQPGTTSCTSNMTVCNSNIAPGSQNEVCVAGGGIGPGDGLDNDCNGTADINPRVADNVPNTCGAAASRTLTVGVGGTSTIVGNVDVNGVDYFLIDFQGATAPGNTFHPTITIASTGNAYTFSVFTNTNCDTTLVTNSACGASGGNIYTTWEALYPGDPNACSSAAGDGRPATCNDSLARRTSYVVRVQRASGSPQLNCVNYTVTATN